MYEFGKISQEKERYYNSIVESGHEKTCLMLYANNKGASAQSDQRLCCSLPR